MKFTKVLILLVIITLSYSLSLRRTEKKNSKLTKRRKDATLDSGNGSWNDGYDCPSIMIAKDNAELANDGKGKFFPIKLENPIISLDKFGWLFEMATIGETLKKVMIQEGSGNRWYIPYRYLDRDVEFTNPAGEFKYLEAWIKTDGKETYRLRVNLPSKRTGSLVSDEDGNKIKNFLNTQRINHRNLISQAKVGANNAGSSYLTNKPVYDTAITSGNNIEVAKTNAQTEKENILRDIENQQNSLSTVENEISVLESQLNTHRTTRTSVSNNMSSLNAQISAINDTLEQIGSSATLNQGQLTAMETEVNTALQNVDAQIAILKVEAPNRIADIDAARAGLLALSSNDFNNNLNKITP